MPARSCVRRGSSVLLGTSFLFSTLVVGVGRTSPNVVTCFGTPSTIQGTWGDDVLYGTRGEDVASAFSGSDHVHGRAGNDRLCGDGGQDVLLDGSGTDLVDGGDGFDLLYLCPDGSSDRWRNVERVVVSTRGCS